MKNEPNPFSLFAKLYAQMEKSGIEEPAAVTLATANADGQPSARIVLLKGYSEDGFVFYTNLESRKAKELRANPHAALCFYWEPIHYQVRVQGHVDQVSDEEADAYFATRPRGSQIGAWISKQSSRLKHHSELEERFHSFEKEYEGRQISRPSFWSGFRLIPGRMEFWRRGQNRLHERTLYVRDSDGWDVCLLYP